MTTQQQQNEWCWTCEEKIGTHKEFRDALGEDEFTCDDCHREEYPEQYGEEEEDDKCEKCGEEVVDYGDKLCHKCYHKSCEDEGDKCYCESDDEYSVSASGCDNLACAGEEEE